MLSILDWSLRRRDDRSSCCFFALLSAALHFHFLSLNLTVRFAVSNYYQWFRHLRLYLFSSWCWVSLSYLSLHGLLVPLCWCERRLSLTEGSRHQIACQIASAPHSHFALLPEIKFSKTLISSLLYLQLNSLFYIFSSLTCAFLISASFLDV